ncbi:MAG: tetratricopeptide repeat protein [Saprospiraceae bacterium]
MLQTNPERYEPYVAMTQNNLGNMYADLNAYGKAEGAYQEALEIRKRLAQTNPERYEPDVATTQNNLGLMYADLNAYGKAEGAYQEALEIYQRLAQTNPERYEPYVAMTQNNLGLMYADLDKLEKAMTYLNNSLPLFQKLAQQSPKVYEPKVARTLIIKSSILVKQGEQSAANSALLEAKALAAKHPEAPFSATVLQFFGQLYQEVNEPLDQAKKQVQPFKTAITSLTTEAEKIQLQQQIVQMVADIWEAHPDNEGIQTYLSNAYGMLAWYALFAQQFEMAEQAARNGLEIDPSQQWINTNLALGLLFQGEYEQAKAVYEQFKDQPFNQNMDFKTAFLQDLTDLEAAGITHPDLEKVRKLLKK